MGSYFGAMHFRGTDANAVVAALIELFRRRGLELAGPEDPEPRRVAVLAAGGWVTVGDQDTELDPEQTEDLVRGLSAALGVSALSILVADSDEAFIASFEGGIPRGRVAIPEGVRDVTDGVPVIDSAFLAPLASSSEGRETLLAGIALDGTFVEEAVHVIGRAIEVPGVLEGARSLLDRRPPGLRVIAFRRPATSPDSVDRPAVPRLAMFVTPLPLGSGDPPLSLSSAAFVVPTLGVDSLTVSVEVDRRSAEGVELRALRASTREGPTVEAVIVVDGDVLRFELPVITLTSSPAGHPEVAGAATGASVFAQHVLAVRFFGATGRPGSIQFRMRASAGSGFSEWIVVEGDFRPPARRCILPELPPEGPTLESLYAAVSGVDYAVGWLSFDGEWSTVSEVVLEWVAALAVPLAATTRSAALAPEITSRGKHPRSASRLAPGGSIGGPTWRTVLDRLGDEAVVEWSPDPPETRTARMARHGLAGGSVIVAHQPRASTIMTAAQLAALGTRFVLPPPVPIEFVFAVHASSETRDIGTLLDRIAREALAQPSCVGGVLGAAGEPFSLVQPTPYETLAGVHPAWNLLSWRRTHARGPAWRVLLPMGISPPVFDARLSFSQGLGGGLLAAPGRDPFSMSDEVRASVETALLPLVGTRAEAVRARVGAGVR